MQSKLNNKIMLKILIFTFSFSVLSAQYGDIISRNIKNSIFGFKHTLLKKPGRTILIAGAIGTTFTYQFDKDTQEWFLNNQPLPESINKFGDNYGNLYSRIIALSSAGFQSYRSKSSISFEYAFTTLVANGMTTVFIKELAMRERPNSADHRSFPSGHVSHSFATASILKEIFGWSIGTPAYILAVITSMNRLQDNKHYLSDVIFGASLGTAFGTGFSKVYFNNKRISIKYNPINHKVYFSYLLDT